MDYVVKPGDSLWSIAARCMGDPAMWQEIARVNRLDRPNDLLIGQRLRLPANARTQGLSSGSPPADVQLGSSSPERRPAVLVPARALFFVIADEVNPLSAKVVRKVAFPKGVEDAELIKRILNPERYGFSPREPLSPVSLGRHVLGRTDSPFISASEHSLGADRFPGKRYWIDVDKVEASGGVIHDGEAIAADLERVGAKAKPGSWIAENLDYIAKLSRGDAEVVIEGAVPAGAVKGAASIGLTRGLQVVQVVGIVLTVYDLGNAGYESYKEKSVRPLAAETVRQAGGWGGAWAGAEALGLVAATAGIETGPVDILIGAGGALVGGIAGYLGADWIADYIHRN